MTGVQSDVDARFDSAAGWWRDVYDAPTTEGAVYRRRRDRVLAWIDELGLPAGASVLDAGAGAGVLAAELARRGHKVLAVDSSEAMVELLRERAAATGLADRLTAATADVHALDAPGDAYDLVVALGVLPWLHEPQGALREMARVARPGAPVILTADNRTRLSSRLHPRALLGRPAPADELLHLYDRAELLAMLAAAGLELERLDALGFGPFWLGGRQVMPERAAIGLEAALQRAADGRLARLRGAAYQYVVLARAT